MAKELTDEQKGKIAEIVFNEWDMCKNTLNDSHHEEYIGYLQGLNDTHYCSIIEEFTEAPESDDEQFNEPANWKDLND